MAHKVFHNLKHKKTGKRVSVAVKLDLSKAYDSVCWDFLFKMLEKLGEKLGFDGIWINWIKQCVSTVKYLIYANGVKFVM